VALEVVFSATAENDLNLIYDWIAGNAVADAAYAYVSRLDAACRKLSLFPARGTARDDLAEGVRTMPFERRATIVYRIEGRVVRILRVLHRGRDLGQVFADEPDRR
jgi:toxin ParE1/3/4